MPDFYQLLEKKKPIYVTNHTGGKIILELRREGHKSKPFVAKIPPIKDYPMLLTKIVPFPILQYDHSAVYEWISKKLLKLHDPDEVASFYSEDPDLEEAVADMLSQANRERVFESKDIGLSTASGAKDRANVFTGKNDPDDLGEAALAMGANANMTVDRQGTGLTLKLAAEQQRVDPKIAELIATLQEDPDKQSDVLIRFRTLNRELLNTDSLGFIIDNSGNFPNINKWARGKLADLSGSSKKSGKKGKSSK